MKELLIFFYNFTITINEQDNSLIVTNNNDIIISIVIIIIVIIVYFQMSDRIVSITIIVDSLSYLKVKDNVKTKKENHLLGDTYLF